MWWLNEFGFKKNFLPTKEQSTFYMKNIKKVAQEKYEKSQRKIEKKLGY